MTTLNVLEDSPTQWTIEKEEGLKGALQDGTTGINTSEIKIGGTLVTASPAELNYVDGVTSGIQDQLDGKQSQSSILDGTTASFTTTLASNISANNDKISFTWDYDYTDLINTPTTITTQQASDITTNNSKVSFDSTSSTKLGTIAEGAEVNVQSDWDSVSGDSLILNKPSIPTQYTDEMSQDAIGGILVDSSEIDFTYDDVTPSITASLKTSSIDESKLDSSVNTSLGKADSALQNISGQDLSTADNTTSAFITIVDVTGINESQLDASVNTSLDLADSALQSFTETDPVFIASQAFNIDSDDITNLSNLSGVNTGDNATNTQYSSLVSNVTTNLSEGTSTETTVDVNSSDGTNATLVSASTTRAGLLTKAKFDEIVANNSKVSYPGSADATELNILDGATLSTAELNILDGVTATTAELNYVDGVTSNVQTQLNAKVTGSGVAKITVGTTTPSSPSTGDLWIDTN